MSGLAAERSRSNLYRCLARNGLNKLPEEEKQKKYNLGFITKILYFSASRLPVGDVAIERNSKFVFAKVYDNKKIDTSASFLNEVLQKFEQRLAAQWRSI